MTGPRCTEATVTPGDCCRSASVSHAGSSAASRVSGTGSDMEDDPPALVAGHPEAVTEHVLLHLARRGARELVDRQEVLGPFLTGHAGPVEVRPHGGQLGHGAPVDHPD